MLLQYAKKFFRFFRAKAFKPFTSYFKGMRVCSGWGRFLLCLPLIFLFLHMFSVLELHQNPTVEDLHRRQPKKFDHLVLGPAAGEGLHDRLQCQGFKAVNKTHFSTSSNYSNFGNRIAFVTVFATYKPTVDRLVNGKSSDLLTVGNTSYNKVERSMAILNVFINFIQVTMPQSNIIILTDPSSVLPVHRNRVTIYPIQGEYSRDKLMLQRIRSYIAFLEAKLEERSEWQGQVDHYIFTDSDIAVVDDLGQIFHDYPNFHLALTFRNNKEQPLNSGFIAVRGTPDGILRCVLCNLHYDLFKRLSRLQYSRPKTNLELCHQENKFMAHITSLSRDQSLLGHLLPLPPASWLFTDGTTTFHLHMALHLLYLCHWGWYLLMWSCNDRGRIFWCTIT